MNYDNLAAVYDLIVIGLFGKNYTQIQQRLLAQLPVGNHLIIGCGSGHLAHAILQLNSKNHVHLLDPSFNMLKRAEKRLAGFDGSFTLLQGAFSPELELPQFSVIHFPFVLDLIPPKEGKSWLLAARKLLIQSGHIHITDFRANCINKVWSTPIYFIFKPLGFARQLNLPDIDGYARTVANRKHHVTTRLLFSSIYSPSKNKDSNEPKNQGPLNT